MNPVHSRQTRSGWPLLWMLALLLVFSLEPQARADLDICGCASDPNSLGAFDTLTTSSYPLGTQSGQQFMNIPLPPNGVMVFNSMNFTPRSAANGAPHDFGFLRVRFIRNAANTPITLLIKNNFSLNGGVELNVSGDGGGGGTTGLNGIGGLGGPGGFRGGDGAYQLVNFASIGGTGFGPGGGLGGTATPSVIHGAAGVYVGVPELLPLVGGCGGGGGWSASNSAGCSGGGGAGGGGAILIMANGTITINGSLVADGGDGAGPGGGCGGYSGTGSGGAIRLVANTIQGGGSLLARSGSQPFIGRMASSQGRIRMESIINNMSASNTDPVASRAPAPGPVANPFNPTVQIKTVGGQAPPQPPQGIFGVVDIILPAPGPIPIVVESKGVPAGTVIKVWAKPRVGAPPITQNITLGSGSSTCDGSGTCTSTITMNLPAGAYTIEAQATLQTP